jgi:hypothetical protein
MDMKKYEFDFSLLGGVKHWESHFSHMAQNGWLIEHIGTGFLQYKKIEPRTIRFCVDALPDIGNFDYPQNEAARNYHALCAEAGWHFVTAQKNIHVFRAEGDGEPLQLHTDDRVQNQIFMQAYRKTELRLSLLNCLVYLLFIAAMAVIMQINAWANAHRFILFTAVGMMPFAALAVFSLGAGARWYASVKHALKHGAPLPIMHRAVGTINKYGQVFAPLFFYACVVIASVSVVRGGIPVGYMILTFALSLIAAAVSISLWHKIQSEERTRAGNMRMIIIGTASTLVIVTGTILAAARFVF